MAYKLMIKLIENLEKGKGSQTKESLIEKCEVYYATDRLSTPQYQELIERIEKIED